MAYVLQAEAKAHLVRKALPISGELKNGDTVEMDLLDTANGSVEDLEALYGIFAEVLREGKTYPQQGPLDFDAFKSYYLSHDTVFVARRGRIILGAFYVKPNFPGRCSHICNHGFLVPSKFRGQGIGTFMAKYSIPLSRLIGYEAIYYNLVFKDNVHAIRIYKRLGFRETGYVPKAGRMIASGGEVASYQDAVQLYYDLDQDMAGETKEIFDSLRERAK